MEMKLSISHKCVLRYLNNHGGVWCVGCGWVWSTIDETLLIMNSLVRRNLVSRVMAGDFYERYELI